MSVTIANIITNLDTYLGDTSTNAISEAERFQAITEAVVWLKEETENDHSNASYTLNHLDTINYYKITSAVPDIIEPVDLFPKDEDDRLRAWTRKAAREIREDIAQASSEDAYSIERKDEDWFLVVNHQSKYSATVLSDLDSTTSGGGTWTLDETNSDATNLTADVNEFQQGSGSLNFDIDVSQSGNNKAVIYNTSLTDRDLSDDEDLSSWLIDVYIPDVTNFTSVTLYLGSDESATPATIANYWSATATTDINGSSFADGWNTVKIDWADATKTGSPDVSSINYAQIDFNYGAGQGDDTDFRIDHLRIARPEKLEFHYLTWDVGEDTNGTDITAFTATTDVPFFSGKYDQYKYAVAHKAASILFAGPLRMREEAIEHETEATQQLQRVEKLFPKSRAPEERAFKVYGVNFRGRRR